MFVQLDVRAAQLARRSAAKETRRDGNTASSAATVSPLLARPSKLTGAAEPTLPSLPSLALDLLADDEPDDALHLI
jgi:hypothetical protein